MTPTYMSFDDKNRCNLTTYTTPRMSVNTRTTVACACTHIPLWCTHTAAILTRKYTNSAVFFPSSMYSNIHIRVQMINSWSTSNKSVRPHCASTSDSKMLKPLMLCSMSSLRNVFALLRKAEEGSSVRNQSCTTFSLHFCLALSFPRRACQPLHQ